MTMRKVHITATYDLDIPDEILDEESDDKEPYLIEQVQDELGRTGLVIESAEVF